MSKALPIAIPAVSINRKKATRSEYYQEANTLKFPVDFSQIIYHQQPRGFAPVLKSLLADGLELGCTEAQVIDRLGQPRYVLNNMHQVDSHKVLFYRADMGPYLQASQFHFFRGRLAYVEFRYLATKKAMNQEILQKLVRRYAGAAGEDHAYQDSEGNRLWVEDGDQLVLHYLSGDSALKSTFPTPVKFRTVRNRQKLGWLRDSA